MTSTLTLRTRGATFTLFAPRVTSGGVEAHACLVVGVQPRAATAKNEKHKYRVPAAEAGFYLGTFFFPEA